MVMAQRKQADRIFMQWRPRGERPDLPRCVLSKTHAVPRGASSQREVWPGTVAASMTGVVAQPLGVSRPRESHP
jgi:hypothetical protein